MSRSLQNSPLRAATFGRSIFSVASLCICLLIGSPIAASAASPICVVKLKVSTDNDSDDGIGVFATQILSSQGYKVIDDWLLTSWSASDYDVRIIITHTTIQNYGFPVTLMGMQLYIADNSGKILVNADIDRANLEGDLRASVPLCDAPPSST